MEQTIIAKLLNKKYNTIQIECPYCFTRYNKDGSVRRGAKRSIHGAGDDFKNRTTHRVSHCLNQHNSYTIIIDNSTKRV